jgi:hypothetical protein
MWRMSTWFSALASGLVLSGCAVVASREPLYDVNKDRVFDPGLVGAWAASDRQLSIAADDAGGYTLTILATPDDGAFDGPWHLDLVRLDGAAYFFLSAPPWPMLSPDDQAAWKSVGSMPLWRVERFGDALLLSALDRQRLVELLAAQPEALKHEMWRGSDLPPTRARPADVGHRPPWFGQLTLTDSPARTRAFLEEHRQELWVAMEPFRRARPE